VILMADRRRLRVVVSDERGRPLRVRGLASWLRRVAPVRARGTVGVALVSDARIRALNRTYRRKDYATDVLSFPSEDVERSGFLGEIVIARGVARRQSRAAAHPEATELRVLALHGLLHLLGYDHERDDGRMARAEQRLRRKGGLSDGLIERASTARGSNLREPRGRPEPRPARPELVDQPPRFALRRSAVASAKAEGRVRR
jgi:probable rRNA maturation factor